MSVLLSDFSNYTDVATGTMTLIYITDVATGTMTLIYITDVATGTMTLIYITNLQMINGNRSEATGLHSLYGKYRNMIIIIQIK